jgi:hypothetical protein
MIHFIMTRQIYMALRHYVDMNFISNACQCGQSQNEIVQHVDLI